MAAGLRRKGRAPQQEVAPGLLHLDAPHRRGTGYLHPGRAPEGTRTAGSRGLAREGLQEEVSGRKPSRHREGSPKAKVPCPGLHQKGALRERREGPGLAF